MAQPPYPAQGGPSPPQACPYPPQGGPYPPQVAPSAPQACPYPSQAGAYPSQGAPYPHGNSDAPPPYASSAPPPAQPAPTATAAPAKQKQKKGGMFSSFMKEVDKATKSIGKEINETVDQNYSSSLMDLFHSGNIVQLVSRATGKTLQILMSVTGQLVPDANGPLDPGAYHTLWTVINEGKNQVRLQNYNNYLAVIDGRCCIVPLLPGVALGPEAKFQLSQSQQFVSLESLKERQRYVVFLKTGEVKPALAASKEVDAQFGVKLVSTAYPVVTTAQPVHKK